MTEPALGEVIFEFRQIGASVKVSAIHVATDTEVSLVAPAKAGEYALRQAAVRKLIHVLKTKAEGGPPRPSPGGGRRL